MHAKTSIAAKCVGAFGAGFPNWGEQFRGRQWRNVVFLESKQKLPLLPCSTALVVDGY